MGFYGNITNTSKTTFQFDKTYANRNQMQMNAGNDGVYPGRFVLVDYDTTINSDYFYKPDPTDPTSQCWMYDGQVYTGAPKSMDINGTVVYTAAPEAPSKITASAGFSKGRCVAVPVGQRISNISQNSIYYRIAGKTETGYQAMKVTQTEYEAFMKKYEEDHEDAVTYYPITLFDFEYEPNVYYTTADGVVFEKAVGEWVETQTYYERVIKQDLFIYIVGNSASDAVLNSTWVTSEELEVNNIYHVKKGHSYNINSKYVEYWVLTKETDELAWSAAADDASTYTLNASIDRLVYGSGRGYDSTVWQKVIRNGRDTYVMIAELNSVVPTFDIAADAPTTIPLVPHFDKDSTNVYYKLHVQPGWAIRTKAQRNDLQGPAIDKTGAMGGEHALTIDEIYYPSDQLTSWNSKLYNSANGTEKTVYYNPNTGTWDSFESPEDQTFGAAIYYNKAGFNPSLISKSADIIAEGKPGFNPIVAKSGWTPEDRIELKPTGLSGKRYDTHNASVDDQMQVDTQELSIMLPSLGDAVSRMWDMVFGGRETNDIIRQTSVRNEDIKWENARGGLNRNGLRMVSTQDGNAYNTAEAETLAGCINSVHDLMGMIITPESCITLGDNIDLLNMDRIYFVTPDPTLEIDPEDPWISDMVKKVAKYQNSYVRKHLTYEYTPVTDEIFEFKPTQPESEDFDITDYYVYENGEYRQATEADRGKTLYKKTIAETATFDPAGLTPFDGSIYFYQDFTSSGNMTDMNADIPEIWLKDYVRDEVYHPGHKYFTIDEENDLEERPLSGAYVQNMYFYKQNGSYLLDSALAPTLNRTYYKIDSNKVFDISDEKAGSYDGIYVPGKYYYLDPATGEYRIDNEPEGKYFGNQKAGHFAIKQDSQESDKPLYIQETHYPPISYEEILEDGFDYDLYIYDDGEGVYKLYTEEIINPDLDYFLKEIRLVPTTGHLVIEPTPLRLALYQENTFYFKEYNDDGEFTGYSLVTPDQIEAVYDSQQKFFVFGVKKEDDEYNFVYTDQEKVTDVEYACKTQSTFYVPHRYHYLTSNDGMGSYLLDHYDKKTHNPYYVFVDGPTPVPDTVKFYEPNKYYSKNPVTGEYEIVREPEMPDTDETPLYDKKTYYVIEDKAGVYEKGAEWNVYAGAVPATVTLGTRKETYDLVQLTGFARNLNTIHGLILKINQLLLTDDKLTRDRATVQGALNTLNDIINRFDKMIPHRLMIVDEYGRVQSTDWNTQQLTSSNVEKTSEATYRKGIGADIYPKAANVDAMQDQWITMHVSGEVVNSKGEAVNPLITIHHNFQAVQDQTKTLLDLNNPAVDQFNIFTPIVDKMGHVVGTNTHPIRLPYGFKYFKTNGESTSVAQLSVTGDTVIAAADNTQDTFGIYTGNKWIRMATDATNDRITIAHEIHTPTTTAIAEVTDLDNSQTFTMQDMQFDAAGHITHNQAHTYRLPDGFKFLAVGDASSAVTDGATGAGMIEANNHVATFTITPGNRWITMKADADSDTLTIGHAFAGTASQHDTQNTNQTPDFGATFNIPYNGYDQAGHLSSFGTKTVKIPLPSLNTATGDVVTGLILEDAAKGKFIMTKANVGTLTISDFTLGSDATAINANDTINQAFAKLQVQMNKEVKDRTDAINALDYTDTPVDGQYVSEVQETDGKIKVQRVELPSVTDTEVDGQYVSAVSEDKGKISITRKDLPSTTAATDETKNGNYVTDVTQEKGKITVHREALPNYSDDTVTDDDGKYVHSVKQTNGKIEVERKELPTYTLTPGEENGTVKLNEEEVKVTGLGTAAYKNEEDFAASDIMETSTFEYAVPETTEEETPEGEDATMKTIEWLFKKVAELEAKIVELEAFHAETPEDDTTGESGENPPA